MWHYILIKLKSFYKSEIRFIYYNLQSFPSMEGCHLFKFFNDNVQISVCSQFIAQKIANGIRICSNKFCSILLTNVLISHDAKFWKTPLATAAHHRNGSKIFYYPLKVWKRVSLLYSDNHINQPDTFEGKFSLLFVFRIWIFASSLE